MVTFNNYGDRYQSSVHYGRQNVNSRMMRKAAEKAAAARPFHQGTENVNIEFNFGPSKEAVIGGVVGTGIKFLLGVLGGDDSSNVSQVQNTYVPTGSSSVSNNSSSVSTPDTVDNNRSTLQTDTAPKASDIDTSGLPAGSSISSVSQGSVDGSPSYVATVQNSDGTTGTYAVAKNSSGKYKIGAQLSKTRGNNYVNQDKLNSALEKEFGKGFELPEGYTAELVGDNLKFKDSKGQSISAAEIKAKAANGDEDKLNAAAAQTTDDEDAASMLKDADKDNTQTLSSDEYKNYVYKMLEADGTIQVSDANRSIVDGLINNSFNEIDKINSDGQLSSDELKKYASESFTNLISEIAEAVGQDGSENANLSIEYDDLTGDGKIDKSEYDVYMRAAQEAGIDTKSMKSFDELDANNDSTITQDELSQQ